jgi:hypothetical protein
MARVIDRLTTASLEATFAIEQVDEPSVIVDPGLDDWGTTVRILATDTELIVEPISDGAPEALIHDCLYYRRYD